LGFLEIVPGPIDVGEQFLNSNRSFGVTVNPGQGLLDGMDVGIDAYLSRLAAHARQDGQIV
jgi:hypothetical protein